MINVTSLWKNSMKSDLRGRGYIKVTFGLINEEAQKAASMNNTYSSAYNVVWYSNDTKLFEVGYEYTDINLPYATLEKDFCQVGLIPMRFLPKENSGRYLYNQGHISKKLDSESTIYARIEFTSAYSFSGMEIDFGDPYPVNFTLYDVTNQKYIAQVTNNDSSKWVTSETVSATKVIRLSVAKMKNSGNRLRIYSIQCGRGLTFTNEDVITSTLSESISPISEELPQSDFSVTLKNYDGAFNYDNPNSIINFFDTGQELKLYYGYEWSDIWGVEWIYRGKYYCSDWEADDFSATIYATDLFRRSEWDEVWHNGYFTDAIYMTKLVNLMNFSELSKYTYEVDGKIYHDKTKNYPTPVSVKERVQQIANAVGYYIYPSNSELKDFELRDITDGFYEQEATSSTEAYCSKVGRIIGGKSNYEYASLFKDHMRVNPNGYDSIYYPPKEGSSATYYSGYISDQVSNDSCTFSTNPKVVISFWETKDVNQITLEFGHTVPDSFNVLVYNNTWTVTNNTKRTVTLNGINPNGDLVGDVTVTFTKTALPHQRIVLDSVKLDSVVDFVMEKDDMLSSPKLAKSELIKDITVRYHPNVNLKALESIYSEENVNFSNGDVKTYNTDDPIGFVLVVITKDDTRVSTGFTTTNTLYSVTVTFTDAISNCNITVYVMKYADSGESVSATLNSGGKSITWDNPMIDTKANAQALLSVLSNYYNRTVTYEYDYRGNPELECGDTIIQENDFIEDMHVDIIEHQITFNGAFSGHIKVLRK